MPTSTRRPASSSRNALPAEMAYTPAEDEFLLEQDWTKLVIRYQ